MALVFGSPEAIEILEKNREIQRRLANAQEEYDKMVYRLEGVEGEIEELENEKYTLENLINELLKIARQNDVTIEEVG